MFLLRTTLCSEASHVLYPCSPPPSLYLSISLFLSLSTSLIKHLITGPGGCGIIRLGLYMFTHSDSHWAFPVAPSLTHIFSICRLCVSALNVFLPGSIFQTLIACLLLQLQQCECTHCVYQPVNSALLRLAVIPTQQCHIWLFQFIWCSDT